MPFIGNQPALSYTSFAKQDFTTSATTSYTLDNPVTNENEIALFINFVRQEPTTAYTASGTSLTLTSATSASDDMYCVFLGKAVQTVNPPSGSVGASQIVDASITSGKLASGVLPTNTPAFHAFLSANMEGLSDAAAVKMQCNTERYDVTDVYDNSINYRFTPGVAGRYFIYGGVLNTGDSDSNMVESEVYIYKNGSSIGKASFNYTSNYAKIAAPTISIVDDANTTDYYELYSAVNTNSGGAWKALADTTQQRTYFGAYRIIGA